jgi:hypothetical protein
MRPEKIEGMTGLGEGEMNGTLNIDGTILIFQGHCDERTWIEAFKIPTDLIKS